MKTHLYAYIKPLLLILSLLFLAMLISTPQAKPASAQTQPTIAFVHVNVIPMDTERVLEDQTVLVENGLITAIGTGDDITIPPTAKVVEGNGAYLMPSLADMHVHLQFDTDPNSLRLYLAQGVTTVRNLNAIMPAHLNWRNQVNNNTLLGPTIYTSGNAIAGVPAESAKYPFMFRAGTVIICILIGLFIWLIIWLLAKYTSVIANFGQLKRFFLPSFMGILLLSGLLAWFIPLTTYSHLFFPPTGAFPESEREARRIVNKQQEQTVDFIKPYDFLPRNLYFATMDEAEKLGIYTAGHTTTYPEVVSLQELIEVGQDEVVHVDEFTPYFWIGYDPSVNAWVEYEIDMDLIEEVATLLAENDIAVTSTLITNELTLLGLENKEALLQRPEYQVIRPEMMEAWRTFGRFVNWQGQETYRREQWRPLLMELTRALNEHGALLNTGTDVFVEGVVPGYAVHQELLLLVEAGLTPFEALSAGTRNPGLTVTRMGRDGNFGTVSIGNRADLMLLPQNPLEDVSHTQERLGVMVRGQWFTQTELDQLVNEFVNSFSMQ